MAGPEQLGFDFTFTVQYPWRLLSVDELYDKMSQDAAVDADEDHRVERKSALYNARALGDYFSMWANTPPYGGIILLGVENDGRITGCNRATTTHLNELQRAGDVFCPDARYQSHSVPVTNVDGADDYLIAFRVLYREDRVVETTAHEAFARRGSSKRRLSDEEKRELQLTKGQIEIEGEPSTLEYPADFNLSLVGQFVENVRRDRGLPDTLSLEQILELRRLGKIRGGVLPAPVFTETTSTSAFVRVTLRNDVEHRRQFVDSDAFQVLGETLSKTLNELERRVVNYVAEHGAINVTEAARLGGKRWQAAKKVLVSLAERNILDHVHSRDIERDAHAYFILKKRFTDRLRAQEAQGSKS